MNFFSLRGVPVKPAVETGVKRKVVAGLSVLDVKTGFVEYDVLYRTEIPFGTQVVEVGPGDKVFVSAHVAATQPWTKDKYEIENGITFNLVPYEVVVGVGYSINQEA